MEKEKFEFLDVLNDISDKKEEFVVTRAVD
jgi:hypothetical protein